MTINPLIAAKPSFRAAVRRAAVAACLVAASVPSALADTSGGGEIHPPGLPCGYTVEVIERPECPDPLGTSPIIVTGMNEAGIVVGHRRDCFEPTRRQAWIWHPGDTTPTDLPTPDDIVSSHAYDISDKNVIVGEFKRYLEPWRGFVYDPNTGEWTELEPVDPSGSGQASANAINNAGVVAGTRSIGESQNPYNAFIWSADDGYTDLGVMEGPNSAARDINGAGHVAGWIGNTSSGSIAFVHNGSNVVYIGPIEGGDTSQIRGINKTGVITGAGLKIDKVGDFEWQKAYRWHKGGYLSVLGPLPEYFGSLGRDISDTNVVVGFSSTPPGPQIEFRATIWPENEAIDLNTLIDSRDPIVLEQAYRINSDGQILARGKIDGSGSSLGFLLTPIETPLGDLNGDCEVGPDDLGLLLSEWNKKDSPADLTGDGTVGGADLGLLLSNWTK